MILNLEVLPDTFSICRLSPSEAIATWALASSFFSITKTSSELSIVCFEKEVPAGVMVERGWRAIKVKGRLDFSLTGILASLATPLANANISIFAISTFDTDYLLIKNADIERALRVLSDAGHRF